MFDWKALFRSHILERGWNYFQQGAVVSLQKAEDRYEALVSGTDDYQVSIYLQNDTVYDMECTCPYAEDGNYCKHMAAVLYQIEEEEERSSGNMNQFSEQQQLKSLIETIPEKELRTLLLETALTQERLKRKILLQYSNCLSPADFNQLRNQIQDITDQYSDRYGFISWKNAMDYTAEIIDFLEDAVQSLIKRNQYMDAFQITSQVFLTASNQDMDDSSGGLSAIGSACYDCWAKILERCSCEEKKDIFQWFVEHQNGCVPDFMEEYIDDFLMNHFHEKEYLKEKLAGLDRSISQLLEQQDKTTPETLAWTLHCNLETQVSQRLQIMEELQYPSQEIRSYMKRFWFLSSVRKKEIQCLLSAGKIQEAIEVLKESKHLDKEYPGLAAEYSLELIQLYGQLKEKELHKKELAEHVLSFSQRNLDLILRLKQLCSTEEWEDYREKLLSASSCYWVQYDLMEAEKLYDRLLEAAAASMSIHILEQHENVLKEYNPEQVKKIYIQYVKRQADTVSDRKRYRMLAGYLKHLSAYPGGKEAADQIAQEWKITYRRRRAMMEELEKCGF